MPRDKDVHMLVTAVGRETLRQEADELGMTVSSYVRWIVNHRNEIKGYQAIINETKQRSVKI